MDTGTRILIRVGIFVFLASSPTFAFAQNRGGIAGVVKDSLGAVLPGVSVEASSPALIEKVRSAVTDGQGQYKIVDLRPGVYTVTFVLPGFSAVKREDIELTTSFTATVNAELRVGAIEETVTVSGQSPTVDVQNVVQAKVMTRDVIDSIPVGNKNTASIGVLIPGVVTSSQDVGGAVFGSAAIAIHGGRTGEMQGLFDGMYFNNGFGVGGSFMSIALNDQTFQEMSFETSGTSAESWMGSIRTNAVPKDGGNTFKGTFFGAYTNHDLQSDNLDRDLQARGLRSVDTISSIWDIAPAFGGPLKKDTLWFFGAWRRWKTKYTIAGLYYNKSPVPYIYDPDLSRPAYEGDKDGNISLRLTWQASPRNKIAIQPQHNIGFRDHFYGGGNARVTNPDATNNYLVRPSEFSLVTWTSPVTSRLLIESGAAYATKDFQQWPQPEVGRTPYSYRELRTNIAWGNLTGATGNNHGYNLIEKFSVSYVTGSHAAKGGINLQHSKSMSSQDATGDEMTLQLLDGLPRQVTVFATPLRLWEFTKYNLGLFAQDQWTINHLTLNVGIRYDHLNSYVPPMHAGPGRWVPTRNVDFPRVDNVPNWMDVSPRLGVAYDLFGNGKTAVKVTLGKYLESPNQGTFTRRANPLNAIVVSTARTWQDANGDFLPQENELGGLQNVNFGKSVINTVVADEVNTNRGYNWETSASIQHELIPRVSAGVAYFRRQYGNQVVTQNVAAGATGYSPYCVTAPVDPRLPNSGGYQLCGFYDLNQLGNVSNVVSLAPDQEEVYDGVDFNMNARLAGGLVISGGSSWGRVRTNTCYALSDPSLSFTPATSGATAPRTSDFCDVRPPFQPNVKFLIVYPLPWWDLQTSATYQGLPGQQITATAVYTGSQIAPSLGRPFSTGAGGQVTLDLIPPGTQFTGRLNQFNFRVTRTFRLGQGRRIQGMVDLYNMFNANPWLTVNNAFGSTWPRPTQVLQGRLLKFSTQIDF